jgi:nucleoside-diphosphate-sugar epimerase
MYPHADVYSFRGMTGGEMREAISHSDVIIHTAAPRISDPLDCHIEGYELTSKIVDAVNLSNKDIRFVNIGSMSYLDADGYMPEEEMTEYAYWKYRSERLCVSMLANVVSARMSTIFYKDGESDILSRMIKDAGNGVVHIWNKGEATRDFIPIDAVAGYINYIATHETPKTVNICSGEQTSFLQVINTLKEICDFDVINHSGFTPPVLSDFTLRLPKIDFSLGEEIKKTFNAYNNIF